MFNRFICLVVEIVAGAAGCLAFRDDPFCPLSLALVGVAAIAALAVPLVGAND